jgi:hypothetical protein
LQEEEIAFTEKDIKENMDYIKATIEEEIVSIKFGLIEGRKRYLSVDEQFQSALKFLPEAEKLMKKSEKL